MSSAKDSGLPEFDKQGLYREDSYTDRRVGNIRQMTPVTVTGEHDTARPVLYMGATQVMTGAGPVPLNFDIPAANLEEAADKFGEAAEKALEDMAARLEALRREQASSIVVPGQPKRPGGSGLIGV